MRMVKKSSKGLSGHVRVSSFRTGDVHTFLFSATIKDRKKIITEASSSTMELVRKLGLHTSADRMDIFIEGEPEASFTIKGGSVRRLHEKKPSQLTIKADGI